MANMNINSAMSAYQSQVSMGKNKVSDSQQAQGSGAANSNQAVNEAANQIKKSELGRTIGEPKLSEKATKYYNQLKKKFGQYDFILVSSDEKEAARANAGKYASNLKTVVLIDEEKIEKMASDEKYRKQYESILSGAKQQIDQIKAAAQNAGASLHGVVMQVNDDGTTSFFAALKKSSEAQKARIEKKAEQKKLEKKEELKKAQKKKEGERIKEATGDRNDVAGIKDAESGINNSKATGEDEIITIMADSLDSLLRKIEEYSFSERSNSIQTDGEKQIGQNIDFRG